MTTISFTTFRQNLAYFLDKAEQDSEEIIVTRSKGRKAVVVPLDEYLSLAQTAYLISSPANRKHLEKSMREAKTGKKVRVAL
jgi:antitoxin YefM